MAVWKLVVWTRVESDSSTVWRSFANPAHVSAALPPWLRWSLDDPAGLKRVLRDGGEADLTSRVRSPLGTVAWPLHVQDVTPGLRFTTQTTNAWFRRFVHRRRIERTIGDGARLVDEVILEPDLAVGKVAAWSTARVLATVQRALVAELRPDRHGTRVHVGRLLDADVAHADALLSGVLGGATP